MRLLRKNSYNLGNQRKLAALLACVFLSACSGGGGGGGGGAAVPGGNTNNGAAAGTSITAGSTTPLPRVQLKLLIPSNLATVSAAGILRRAQSQSYISSSNAALSIVVTPVGGIAMAPVVAVCTSSVCTASFTANPGVNTIAFTLTDTAGGGGNVLASFSSSVSVQPNAINTLDFSANPVVDHVSLALSAPSVIAGVVGDVTLTVNAFDADNNIIVGNGNFINAAGVPLALVLTASNSEDGGNGTVGILGPLRITGPSQGAIDLHYNGRWLDHTNIAITPTQPISGGVAGVALATVPTTMEYGTGITSGALTQEIAVGPDGNFWFTENGQNRIGRITQSGVVTEFTLGITAGAKPYGITAGPDGNMWFTENGTAKIGRITMSGTVTEFTGGGGSPIDITAGPDGNLWFTITSPDKVGRITPQGIVTTYSTGVTSGATLQSITTGPDGNIWFTEYGNKAIGRITPSGVVSEFSSGISGTFTAEPYGITTGPDGNLWFTEYGNNKIGRITPLGAITEFSTGITSNSGPRGITVGIDGNLWFTEYSRRRVASISLGGLVTEYAAGVSSGANPGAIVLGPEGNLWYAEAYNDTIARFVF